MIKIISTPGYTENEMFESFLVNYTFFIHNCFVKFPTQFQVWMNLPIFRKQIKNFIMLEIH